MSYTILTDSSCNLPERVLGDAGVKSMPFSIANAGHTGYAKDVFADLKEFYDLMRAGKIFTTSQPNQQCSGDIIRSIFDRGDDILYISFSSGLSGSYNTNSLLLETIVADYPGCRVLMCDTLGASLGEGLLVKYAIDMKAAGKSIDEVHAWLEKHKLHLAHWFTVDDLRYLYRGGRLSRTTATTATLLKIKPVLHMDDAGHLVPVENVRTRKRSIEALYKHMKMTYDTSFGPQHIAISHGDCLHDVNYLRSMIEANRQFNIADFTVNYVDPVIGAHSGPGTLAVFYLATSRN